MVGDVRRRFENGVDIAAHAEFMRAWVLWDVDLRMYFCNRRVEDACSKVVWLRL